METYTIAEQILCVEREIKFRVRVYARRIAEGKMTKDFAERECNTMRAVLATLHDVARREAFEASKRAFHLE